MSTGQLVVNDPSSQFGNYTLPSSASKLEDAQLPSQHRMANDRKQMSFTSMSSSESGLDLTGGSYRDTVDAVPKRMPLFDNEYMRQRKASVENLLASRTPEHAKCRHSRDDKMEWPYDIVPQQVKGERSNVRTSTSCDFQQIHHDNDPYSYLKLKPGILSQHNKGHALSEQNGLCENYKYDTDNCQIPMTVLNNTQPKDQSETEMHPPFKESQQMNSDVDDKKPKEVQPDIGTKYTNRDENINTEAMVTDSCASRPPRPVLKGTEEISRIESESSASSTREPDLLPQKAICTPPKEHTRSTTRRERSPQKQDSCCCCRYCCSTFCALFKLKYLFTRFSIWDLILTIGSICVYVFDVATDLLLSLKYYRHTEENEHYWFFFILTLGLVVVPSLIVQAFSYYWVVDDFQSMKREKARIFSGKKRKKSACRDCMGLFLTFLPHLFQMGTIFRYLRSMHYGIKSRYYEVREEEGKRNHFEHLWKYEMHDVNMLRLLESFLESAPQLVLQIYIMLMTKQISFLPVVSCCGSLISLSTMMVSFQRAIRNSNKDKKQLSIIASVTMLCWRACTISSRVLAFALFLTIQPLAFLVFILFHWFAATVWIAWQGTKFCTSKCSEYLFNAVCGLIYIFCFLNVSDSEKGSKKFHTRTRMCIFYVVVFVENVVLSLLWFFFRPGGGKNDLSKWRDWDLISGGIWQSSPMKIETTTILIPNQEVGSIPTDFAFVLIIGVIGFFILGLIFMMIYYLLLHPRHSSFTFCCVTPRREIDLSKKNYSYPVSAPLNGSNEHFRNEFGAVESLDDEDVHLEEANIPKTRISAPRPRSRALEEARQNFSSEECTELLGSENTGFTTRRRYVQESRPQLGGASFERIDDSSSSESNESTWTKTIFNRGKRARRIYNRQYSEEKLLEEGGGHPSAVGESNMPYRSRETDRFKSTVTPTRDKKIVVEIGKATTRRPNPEPTQPSIVIKPGSQPPAPSQGASRSATHQGPLSSALTGGTPLRTGRSRSPMHSFYTSPPRHSKLPSHLPRVPGPVESRDYSASMSRLMDRPLSYVARREMAFGHNMPRVPSFSVAKNEILECIESSV